MQGYNRRHFLRWLFVQLAALLGVETLAGCGSRMVQVSELVSTLTQSPGDYAPKPSPTSTDEPQPTSTATQPASAQALEPTPTQELPTATFTDKPEPTATRTPKPQPTKGRPAPTNTSKPKPTQGPPTATPTAGSPPTATNTSQPQPTNTPSPPTPTPTRRAGTPYMAVTRGGTPPALVRQAINAIGGMGKFVKPGNNVIIKPNICVSYRTYEYAATTNPSVVAELVKLALQAGASRVTVLDYPFGGTCEDAYRVSGIEAQVLAAGGQMEPISMFKFVMTNIPQGKDLKSCEIYEDILNADVVINVPIAKHHSLSRLTLGMKNLMGTIKDRPAMHKNIGQRLADLASRIRPALTVVDAVRILVRNGPTGGRLSDVQKIDTVIATKDIVAADSYAATLFGVAPDSLSYVAAGTAMGLGRSDLENLYIEEINLGG